MSPSLRERTTGIDEFFLILPFTGAESEIVVSGTSALISLPSLETGTASDKEDPDDTLSDFLLKKRSIKSLAIMTLLNKTHFTILLIRILRSLLQVKKQSFADNAPHGDFLAQDDTPAGLLKRKNFQDPVRNMNHLRRQFRLRCRTSNTPTGRLLLDGGLGWSSFGVLRSLLVVSNRRRRHLGNNIFLCFFFTSGN